MVNIAINGAGRIGLIFLRILAKRINSGETKNLNVVLLNDPFANLKDIEYRLKYDSAHGKYTQDISIDCDNNKLRIGSKCCIEFVQHKSPQDIDYDKHKISIVVECSGVFTEGQRASMHMSGPKAKSVRHVVISAPAKDSPSHSVKTLVFGVNEDEFDANCHRLISNASCTTNCLAPIIRSLKRSFGEVKWCLMTTTHASTATQHVVDSASIRDLASGRSALCNIIPASTGAARAVSLVCHDMSDGKMDGIALRVPVVDVSVTDFVVECGTEMMKRPLTLEDLKKCFMEASEGVQGGPQRGIIGLAHEGAVSSDFLGDTHSAIIDMSRLIVCEGRILKGLAFYDNEMGYSTRLNDLVEYIASKMS